MSSFILFPTFFHHCCYRSYYAFPIFLSLTKQLKCKTSKFNNAVVCVAADVN